MQNLTNKSGSAYSETQVNDLGPLAWVLDELRKSLDAATKSLRRYVRDAELARGSDLEAADTSQLRISRQQLHQAVGALEMVGFAGPALLLRAMESAVQKFVLRPELCTEAATSKIERASFALTGYLQTVLSGKAQAANALFVQYSDVQELAGATRIHPADLWDHAWRWTEISSNGTPAMVLDADTRLQFDKAALQVIKLADAASATKLALLSAGISAPTNLQVEKQFTIFWRIAAAFFEAVGQNCLKTDVYAKRTVSRILIQLAAHTKGDLTVSDRLAQDLLFFCAQAAPKDDNSLLKAAREAYGLTNFQAFDYSQSPFGHFDPALLLQARKRITAAKESWSLLAAGEMGKLKAVQDQFGLIAESIGKLLPKGQALSRALMACVELVAKQGQAPEPTMAMEVATSILYLEAGFEDFDPNDAQQAMRIDSLAQRIDSARGGALDQALEPWMEELYRRVSDRQTLGSVVGELKISLADVEKSMDQFFREPHDKAPLANVPSRLGQMRGVLSVLGLEQASHAVLRMRETVEAISTSNADDAHAPIDGAFDKLGNNLGALGFLIDMLSYQPVLAKKLFIFDESLGELKPLMGRVNAPIPAASSLASNVVKPTLANAEPEPQQIVAAPAVPALTVAPVIAAVAVVATGAVSGVAGLAATTNAPPANDVNADDDAELLDIFLEEAREVIQTGRASLAVLAVEPQNQAEMTVLRRAFHTLKGSSRMVGLSTFGEAGWSLEQLLNGWLADQKPASADLCAVSSQGLNGLAKWVEDIATRSDQAWSSAPFRVSADALRLSGAFISLAIPGLPEGELAFDAAQDDLLGNEVVASEHSGASLELSAEQSGELPVDSEQTDEDDVEFAFELSDFAPEGDVDLASTLTVTDEASTVELAATEPLPELTMDQFIQESAALDPINLSTDPALDLANQFDIAQDTQDDLISADELAAFERAMNEQAAIEQEAHMVSDLSSTDIPDFELPDLDLATLPAAIAVDTPVETSGINDIDFSALQAISDQHYAAASTDFVSGATQAMQLSELPIPKEEPRVSNFDFSLNEFSNSATAEGNTGSSLSDGVEVASGVVSGAISRAAAYANSIPAPLASSDDLYKAIGPLRINLPLYNVYLNEADEWSRRLVGCLTEWSLEPGQPIPPDAIVWAHSLAGSSATVGFSVLSALSRTMENALNHLQTLAQNADYPAHQHAAALLAGAEEMRHLLHQFAAGILKEPQASAVQQLQLCLDAPEHATEMHAITAKSGSSVVGALTENAAIAPVDTAKTAIKNIASVPTTETSTVPETLDFSSSIFDASQPATLTATAPTGAIVSAFSSLQSDSTVTVIAAASAAGVVGLGGLGVSNLLNTEPLAATPVPQPLQLRTTSKEKPVQVHTLTVVPRTLSEQEAEEDIDLVDAIDPDLFPIFEEEAQELLPQMGTSLRQWSTHPKNTGARSELLRGLHTLKGSARLAGALRLGELAHRMESAVELIPQEDAQTSQIEPLLGVLDGLQSNFERTRHPTNDAIATESAGSLPASNAVTAVQARPAAAGLAEPAALINPVLATPIRSMPMAASSPLVTQALRSGSNQTVRVRTQLLDRMVNQAGEVIITRSRLEAELGQLRGSLGELTGNLEKLRSQLRDIEVQSESQMQSRMALAKESEQSFDPLEFDRFTRVQELTRMMAESVNDVATVQRNIQRTVEATEDDLVAQARQTRDLQRDLLRTRMVEFEGISERLYRVVRQASKDSGKLVKLDITGGSIEMDRGVLDRMTPAFEHLLRNCVAHGIEDAAARVAAGKDASGQITISLHQEGNDVSVEFRDDGAGLNLARIRERAQAQGLLAHDQTIADGDAANLIFTPGFTTATQVTELSGRGIGMDVVRSEVSALGGRIETSTASGQGTNFKLVLPLTTAVTQVVMVRVGTLAIGVPANLIDTVRRASPKELQDAYNSGTYQYGGETLPFFWSGALLQHSRASAETPGKTIPIMVFRSAAQRIVAHIDEVLGNQEVVVKNLGPQLSRLPGLAGMTVLASGAVALIYNPVALASVYGEQARAWSADKAQPHVLEAEAITDVVARDLSDGASPVVPLVPAVAQPFVSSQVPLILVVDDSITVRRVTQRLLQREGYRVSLAADGLQALERLAEAELPSVILSDIEMPRMDGFDLARNIKADPRLAVLPIIMITSRIAEKHREHAMSLGVNHYLGKPYSEEELLSLIKRYTSLEIAG